MSKESINDRFRDALGSYASELDEGQLWSEIEHRVPRKKSKRRLLVWIFFGLGLGVMVMKFSFSKPNYSIENDVFANTKVEAISDKLMDQKIDQHIVDKGQKLELNPTSEIVSPAKEHRTIQENLSQQTKNLPLNRKEQKIISEDRETQKSLDDSHVMLDEKDREIFTQRKYIQDVYALSSINIDAISTKSSNKILLRKARSKKQKRVKPIKPKRAYFELNVQVGRPFISSTEQFTDAALIDKGNPYYSHGVSFQYNQFFTSKWYGIVAVSVDQTYLKYADQVVRDTLVPTSAGEQIIAYNEYLNGFIDSESGIPNVNGKLQRDVLNLNVFTIVSAGVGLGKSQSIGKFNFNIEALYQRSLHIGISGLGRAEGDDRIKNLNAFKDYFAPGAMSSLNTSMKVNYSLSKSISLTTGLQYQFGLTDLLAESTRNSEKLSLLRFGIGIKKAM